MCQLGWIILCFFFSIVAKADSRLLHEYIPNVRPDEADRAISAGPDASPVILYNGRPIEMPPDSLVAGDARTTPTAATNDQRLQTALNQRISRFFPDRTTEFKGSLSYYDVFNPSIAPFKRATALGMVRLADDGKTPVLDRMDTTRKSVLIGDIYADPPDPRPRDRFWGDVLLDFSSNAIAPMPSVSPESRILFVDTAPRTALKFEKDGDDNFYAVALDNPRPTRVRLRFITDAPRSYFGTAIPQLESNVLEREISPLPTSVSARAKAFAREIGIARRDDLKRVIHTLTRHFRSFEEAATTPWNTGDVYSDLVRGLKGVCRHRAYGFAITAQALGVPARLLQNEAHSWVEVKLPGLGWMRIDLGGAAQRVEARGVRDKSAYWPVWPDELPRPKRFEEAYRAATQIEDSALSTRGEELVGRWVPESPKLLNDAKKSRYQPPVQLRVQDRLSKMGVSLRVDQKRVSVLRGKTLNITGQVLAADKTLIRDLDIEVSLAVSQPAGKILLGITKSRDDGAFAAGFTVPADIPVGDYRLIVKIRAKDANNQGTLHQTQHN
jgi:hypothetical protein